MDSILAEVIAMARRSERILGHRADRDGYVVKADDRFVPFVWNADRHRAAIAAMGLRCRCRSCED